MKVTLYPDMIEAESTDEMREHRRLHGDKGERFSGRLWRPSTDGICNTITSVLKDFYVIEIYG